MSFKPISVQTLQRMPLYLNYLKTLPSNVSNISATAIAEDLMLNDVQVRKDLAMAGQGGRPKVGYLVKDLIADMEQCLGYDNTVRAVIIGLGNFGRTLLVYEGFSEYGIDMVSAFDTNEELVGTTICGKQVLPANMVPMICSRMKIKMGIITVDAKDAQTVCDSLVKGGVMAIWNFAPVRLHVPDYVLVQNETMESSLAVLSNHLADKK